MSAEERTGWRDSEISLRHRLWGFNCPAVDLDFVMLEYNHGKPCALIEYKHKRARQPDPSHATYRALVDFADKYSEKPLPCLVAFYDPDNWTFRVIPLNEPSRNHYSHCAGQWISEQRFVRGLHLLRKAVLTQGDEYAIAQLNDIENNETANHEEAVLA